MKLIKIIVIFVTFYFPINIVYGNDIIIDRFIDNENISYSTSFSVNTSLNKWDKMLDNLMVMGVLWKMYGLSPYYNVLLGEKDGVYIIDPKGIEGNIYSVQSNNFNRAFETDWVIKSPKVPFSFSGKSMILLKYEGTKNNVSGSLKIYTKIDNIIAEIVIAIIKPILLNGINDRVSVTFNGIEKLIQIIEEERDIIRLKFKGQSLKDFNEILQ